MEVEVKVLAIPASWDPKGYYLSATTLSNPEDYPNSEGVLVGQATFSVEEPTQAQLIAVEIACLRKSRKIILDKANATILPIDTRIQNLLALEA
jgi:hypothetical protein